MLRFLIIFLYFLTAASHAEQIKYKEPEGEALKSAKAATQSVFDITDSLKEDSDFLKNLQIQRQAISTISSDVKSNLYDLENINPMIQEDRVISMALAAGEKIQNHSAVPWTNAPMVLVSLSMPDSKIKSLMGEAAKVGANIVLRGAIDNDIGKTVERIRQMSDENQTGGIQIDPTLFRRFKVNKVPTFILPLEPVKTCDENGCEVPEHIKAHGTASLLYFLEKASRLGGPKAKETAESWLNVYKGGDSDSS